MLALTTLLVQLACASSVKYIINVKTADLTDSGTDSDIYIKIKGTNGQSVWASVLAEDGRNDFDSRTVDDFIRNAADVGEIACITMETGGSDAFLFDWVSVYSHTHSTNRYFYNTHNTWLSRDSDEGHRSVELCEQGQTKYYISMQTSTRSDAGSDNIYLKMRITGDQGQTITGFVDKIDYDEFEKGRYDTFAFRSLKDVGVVNCLELFAYGSDAWHFDFVTVQPDNGKAAIFMNTSGRYMSYDSGEGLSYMKMCN